MSDMPPRRRREGLGWPPRPVIIPLLGLVLLFAGWSVVWYYGSRHAEAELTRWVAREAGQGRSYDCTERTVGGYPFRIEVDCRSPTAEIVENGSTSRISAARLHAVAMVWQLEHVILEIEGPLHVENAGEGGAAVGFEAEWSRMQTSLRAPGGRIARVDVVIDDARLRAAPGSLAPGAPDTASADRFALHQRQEGGGDMELAVNANGLTIAGRDLPTTDPADFALLARLIALPRPMPRETAEFVAAWRANDGAVEILDLRAAQADTVLRAEGRLSPDARGRPEGSLTVSLAGPDIRTPGAAGAFGGVAPVLAAALRLGGRSDEIDGRQAVAGHLDFEDGVVRFGPLSIARLPPLF